MRASLVLSVALAALTGCDQLLKLSEVSAPRDSAGGGDSLADVAAGPDAPAVALCDATHVPTFGSTQTNVLDACSYYTESPPRNGIGVCNGTIVGIDVVAGSTTPQNGITAGLSPSQSGDRELFVNDSGNIYSYVASATANTWTSQTAQSIPLTLAAGDHVSAPSGMRNSSGRRMVVFRAGTPWTALELVSSGSNTWAGSVPLAAQLMATVTGPGALSHDGLRLVFPTAGGVSFSARPDVTSTFTAAMEIFTSSTTPTTATYLTEDCSRLYFTDGTGALAYADRVQ